MSGRPDIFEHFGRADEFIAAPTVELPSVAAIGIESRVADQTVPLAVVDELERTPDGFIGVSDLRDALADNRFRFVELLAVHPRLDQRDGHGGGRVWRQIRG
jgi:hypothetical protein